MSQDRQSTYQKFKAVHRRLIGNDRVWLTGDHILLVESTGVSETYKRFYFKDIQAVNILKTKARAITLTLSGLCIAVLVMLNIGIGLGTEELFTPFLISSIFPGIFLLFKFLKTIFNGPTCKCLIYSFVQKEQIRPIKNLKTADRFMDVIIPRIESAQGVLSPGKLNENTARIQAPEGNRLRHAPSEKTRKVSPVWHVLLFFGLLILSVFAVGDILFRSPVLYLAGSIVFFIILLINIAAIVRQVNSTLSLSVKSCSITAVVLMCLTFVYGYVEFFFLFTQNAQEWFKAYNNHWELAKYFTQINLFDYPILLGFSIFFTVTYFLLGLFGLVSLWRQKD